MMFEIIQIVANYKNIYPYLIKLYTNKFPKGADHA